MHELFTIGYEGMAQETLLHTLVVNNIQTLIDIRELPLSRKPGFSKTALGNAVHRVGIDYLHLRALGTPRDIRYQRKIDHDEGAFRRDFLAYLDSQNDAVEYLTVKLQKERCCVLCYEADAKFCHRSLVAERIQERMQKANLGPLHIVNLAAETEARSG